MSDILFHTMPDGRNIAHRYLPGTSPALVFLPGYKSDMEGGKATALLDWAQDNDRACLLLDYSGCGQSSGDFADGTLGRWCDEVLDLISAKGLDRVILVGSSMGGWLMLLIGLKLGPQLAGMVGIAAAPDFTDWGRSVQDKLRLRGGETVFDENPYGPEPTPIHPGFFLDGQDNLLLGDTIPIDCPVRLLHGQADNDVPWDISMRLAGALRSDDVQVTLIKDGDHRLSRDRDIALLLAQVDGLLRHAE
ncbi:alpha/beta hydrolase [Parerythrobacter lacustris]|uniref:Palmitoyl-protein thioesterase ABHD10, mitochondrial n=1 Tax=Parerythrobacter lacustris TaxID=2969984 RepID=A0ABT1XL88_9SPHN|nr:alpha/beta hydrolase [Parerythrobacter lacustris]MCR2832428.1 alpha/beta hydrolase [Parerythrobacter lacustris]